MSESFTTQIVRSAGTEHFVFDGATIEVRKGPDKGAKLELSALPMRIGTAKDCDLVLGDPTVSAYHVEITPDEAGYVAKDLGSTNAMLLGAHKVREVVLGDRMKLSLGKTQLLVRSTKEALSLPLHDAGVLGELVAHSVAMRALVAQMEKIAPTEMTVLIEGETGAGKEVVARAVHALSDRQGPFVVADLTAIPSTLFAAELFGYEKGAFSGADRARAGLFEEAAGGTIFLDELGELPIDLQPQLLRAVERRETRRVGSHHERKHDVRIVAATNRNLQHEVREGGFREDLYYRLSAGRLRVPPLRARKEDIPHLARNFATELGCLLSADIVSVLTEHRWPGNVRELRNTIERLAAVPEAPWLEPDAPWLEPDAPWRHPTTHDASPAAAGPLLPLPEARKQASWQFERSYLERLLEQTDRRLTEAAELAGVSHSMIARMVKRHKL
jgi:DNA-binding NtrC family response regulator